jgi:protein-tyrosine phosphatase
MPSVLFVCTANRFRSPLGAAIFRKCLEELGIAESWQVSSAGTWAMPGQPALAQVAEMARGLGLDLSGHRSRRINRQILASCDLVLVMQAGHREALLSEDPALEERVYLLSEVAERRRYDIPDALGSEQEMREVIYELDSLICGGLESICALATYLGNTAHA